MELLKCKCGYDHFEYLYEINKLDDSQLTIYYQCRKCEKEIQIVIDKTECSKIVIER